MRNISIPPRYRTGELTKSIASEWRVLLREVVFWVLVLCALLLSRVAIAQSYGTLDSSWGGSGLVNAPIAQSAAFGFGGSARAIATQLDGKVVVAGMCYRTPSAGSTAYFPCVARYNTNGSFDTTFNSVGSNTVTTVNVDVNRQATAVAISPYGHIVVAFGCKNASNVAQFCALQFTSNGAIDTSFGGSGLLMTSLTTQGNYPASVAFQSTGRIVLGGICGNRLCALRFTASGGLDTSFDSDGQILNTATGTTNRETYMMAVDIADRVLLAGTCSVGGREVFCISRFSANGAIDNSFGSNGLVTHDLFTSSAYAYGIAIQEDFKILLAGQTFNSIGGTNLQDFALVRYEPNGAVDTSFGTNGVVLTRVANWESTARSVVSQTDGKILVAGVCQDFPERRDRFCIAGYNSDGSPDTSFNATGLSKQLFLSQSSPAFAIALGRDSKLMVAGECQNGTSISRMDFCVARYNGSPDGGRACNVDFDVNYEVEGLMNTDALIYARVSRGVIGDAVIANVPIFANAGAQTWPHMFKLMQLFSRDLDGDGFENEGDATIYARFALGFTGNALTNGIAISPTAKRPTPQAITNYLLNRCGPYIYQSVP